MRLPTGLKVKLKNPGQPSSMYRQLEHFQTEQRTSYDYYDDLSTEVTPSQI